MDLNKLSPVLTAMMDRVEKIAEQHGLESVRLPRGGHLSFVLDPVCVAREVIHFSEGIN